MTVPPVLIGMLAVAPVGAANRAGQVCVITGSGNRQIGCGEHEQQNTNQTNQDGMRPHAPHDITKEHYRSRARTSGSITVRASIPPLLTRATPRFFSGTNATIAYQ